MKTILNVKPFQETLNAGMCGPASLKIILSYYGIEKGEDELAHLCKTNSLLGTSDINIRKTAENLGFQVKIKNNSTFNDIEHYLKKEIPLIVDWFTSGVGGRKNNIPDGHYSVIYGIDKNNIYLQDPELGASRKISKKDFETVWFDFKGRTINAKELIIRQLIIIKKSDT